MKTFTPVSTPLDWERNCRSKSLAFTCFPKGFSHPLSKLWELVMDRGGLACCSPQGPKELDTTERLN